jgi:hypothetical protein
MAPPEPKRPRPGSSPKIQAAEVDKLVGKATDLVGASPRRQTFTGLGAMKPPALPGELAVTMPAPSTTAATARPTPPTGVRVVDSESPSSGRGEAREALLLEELAKERSRVAELERRERVRAESRSPGPLELPVIPSDRPERITKAPESTAASEGSTKALRSALTKLVLGIAALLAILGIPLTAYIQALTTQIERSTSQAAQANAAAADAKAGNSQAKQEAAASKAELAAFKAYFREVMRLQGVEIAKGKDDPDAGDLKPVAPLCPAGKVCPGAQLIITVPP